jgi:hypothetical protein
MPRAFERVAGSHWSYTSVRQLEADGYPTGAPEGAFSGRQALTRFDFAAAVERIYRSLQPRLAGAAPPPSLRRNLGAFRDLLREFSDDIRDLGYDPVEMARQADEVSSRLERQQTAARAELTNAGPLRLDPFRRSPFGLDRALSGSPLAGALPSVRPAEGSLTAAGLGSFQASLQYRLADPLDALPGAAFSRAWQDGGSRATLNYSLGGYLLGAFITHDGPRADRYGLANPFLPYGSTDGIGGSLSGSFSDRLRFGLESARLTTARQDSPYVYFRGDLDYSLKAGFGLGAGYERSRLYGPQGVATNAYTLGLWRALGPNSRFNLFYRYFDAASGSGGRNFGDSGALGSITVRF